jgi:hypothetical protein
MRICSCVLGIALLPPGMARAQAGPTDGIRAFVNGDYATAAAILRPLAEASADPDPFGGVGAQITHDGNKIEPQSPRYLLAPSTSRSSTLSF